MTTPLTTAQAARRLGVSRRHVALLIRQGKLAAAKVGRDWLIRPADLEAVRRRPGRGRPKGP